MDREIKFSIHVPVYKTEPYLTQCVDSILHQTYGNFELLLMDDGSPDTCPAMCDAFAAADSRIRVIHQENQGLLMARRNSLRYTTGNYILFVDSDDWVAPNWLETIYDAICRYDADIVLFDMIVASAPKNECFLNQLIPDVVYFGDSRKGVQIQYLTSALGGSLCDKAYSISCFDCDADYSMWRGIQCGEDSIQLAYPMAHFQRAVYISEPLYFYRQVASSMCHQESIVKYEDWMKCWYVKHQFREAQGINDVSVISGMARIMTMQVYALAYKMIQEGQQYRAVIEALRHMEEFPAYQSYRPHCFDDGETLDFRTRLKYSLLIHRRYTVLYALIRMIQVRNHPPLC